MTECSACGLVAEGILCSCSLGKDERILLTLEGGSLEGAYYEHVTKHYRVPGDPYRTYQDTEAIPKKVRYARMVATQSKLMCFTRPILNRKILRLSDLIIFDSLYAREYEEFMAELMSLNKYQGVNIFRRIAEGYKQKFSPLYKARAQPPGAWLQVVLLGNLKGRQIEFRATQRLPNSNSRFLRLVAKLAAYERDCKLRGNDEAQMRELYDIMVAAMT